MEKPKVRFSHNFETVTEPAVPKKVNHVQEKAKVKVKSIVPVNLPIKLLKNGKRLLLKDLDTNDVQLIAEQNINRLFNSQHVDNKMHTNDNCKEINSRQLIMSKPEQGLETQISETPANYMHLTDDEVNQMNKNDLQVQNCADKLQGVTIVETDKVFPKGLSMKLNQIHKNVCNSHNVSPIEKGIPCIHLDSSDNDEDVREVNNFNYHKFQQKSKNKVELFNRELEVTHQENKENKEKHNDCHKSLHKIRATKNSDILKDCTSASFNKNRNVNTKKPAAKVQRKLQVMPCAKFKSIPPVSNKHTNKQVTSKTKSLFNIAGKASDIEVQPEMSNIMSNQHSKCHLKKSFEKRDIASKNLLSQPEYNSAVCIMKKLKEIGEERLINDVESLPVTYRDLIQGKVSAALDFGPYESVYKNLINLSADEDELPTRLTRTKKLEPRNKDVTPTLSQFYSPKSTPEHFMSLNPKIFDPVGVNTLNAFTISNKICTWRISRDSF